MRFITKSFVLMTITVVFITIAMFYGALLGLRTATALLFGLEGTVLLASAFSTEQLDHASPKTLFSKLKWYLTRGSEYGVPVCYHPMAYYGGLLFIAISLVLSAIN